MKETMSVNYSKLMREVIAEAKNLNIPVSNNIHPMVRINTRAKSRLAQCKRNRSDNGFIIEVCSFMEQASKNSIKEILAHEILHTCPDCFNHGTKWQSHGMKMNRAHGYNISRTADVINMGITIKKERNYVIQCQKCDKEIVRERMSNVIKNPENYRCSCGGNLKLL